MRHLAFLPIVFFATLAALLLSSCTISFDSTRDANGNVKDQVTANHGLAPFNSIDCKIAAYINYVESDTFFVEVECDKNKVNDIKFIVDDSLLIIKDANGSRKSYNYSRVTKSDDDKTLTINLGDDNKNNVNITVHAPKLNYLTFSGAVEFNAKKLNTDNITFITQGASDLNIDSIKAEAVEIYTKGASDINIKDVNSKQVTVKTAGASDCDIAISNAELSKFDVAGSGSADISFKNCKKAITNIAGAGSITLKGDLETLEQQSDGVSSIDTDDLKVKTKK